MQTSSALPFFSRKRGKSASIRRKKRINQIRTDVAVGAVIAARHAVEPPTKGQDMAMWHADVNGPTLASGTNVVVFSPHRVVRVMTADQVLIETPQGNRISAIVLDRTGSTLTIALSDGRPVKLTMADDESLHSGIEVSVFSRQIWSVN
jgi:hypothetical protein